MAILVLSLLTAATRVAAETAQEVMEKVKHTYESIGDAELKFSETDRFALSNVERSITGTLQMKKEHKYRVAMGGDTIVTDGTTVWRYSASTNQVLIDRFKMDERAITPERILGAAPGEFVATLVGRDRVGTTDVVVLKLIPSGERSSVKSMKLWIDESEWFVRKAEVIDVSGKQTSYTVSEARFNLGIPDSRFTYSIPEGAEVVDLR